VISFFCFCEVTNTWTIFSVSLWDQMCLIFLMLRRWKKAVLEICFRRSRASDMIWFVDDLLFPWAKATSCFNDCLFNLNKMSNYLFSVCFSRTRSSILPRPCFRSLCRSRWRFLFARLVRLSTVHETLLLFCGLFIIWSWYLNIVRRFPSLFCREMSFIQLWMERVSFLWTWPSWLMDSHICDNARFM